MKLLFLKKISIYLICLVLSPVMSWAQNEVLELNFDNPQNTVKYHVDYTDEDNFEPEKAAAVFNDKILDLEQRTNLAVLLRQIYKGSGLVINLEEISNDPHHLDTASEKNIFRISEQFPDIYLEKYGDRWLYSDHTAKHIEDIHKQIYPFGADKLLTLLPKLGNRKILGLHLWQHITIFLIIFLSLVINKLFVLTFKSLIFKLMELKGKGDASKKYIVKVSRPLSILIVFPLLTLFIPVIQLPAYITSFLITVLKVLWPFFATLFFYRMVDILGIYLEKLAARTETTLDDQLVPLARKTMRIFVVIIGALAILSNFDVDIWPLLTGLSIGGLAVALAAQDTLKNLFGSVMIFVDKPFQVGDWITSGDIDGTVEEVGFRSTRVRTFRNSVTYVPNGKIADSTIDNHGLRQFRRFYTTITVTYDTPTHLIEAFVDGLRKIVESHPDTRKDVFHIYFNDMGAFSLNIMFYIFFAVPTWGEELRCRHEILLQIMKLAESLGVQFAFPTQTLHMESFPEKQSNSPVYEMDKLNVKERLNTFFKGSPEKDN
ncbi:MAG: mechanosensitive ion channel family protein [Cyclobacteriaceae bacterium]